MSHSELAEQLKIPKSSLTQLIRTMLSRGYLNWRPEDKKYTIGQRLAHLASATTQIQGLRELAPPILERVTALTGESTFLNVLEGYSARLVARVIGPQPLVTALAIGQTVPLYATAGGRAILAFLPERMIDDYVRNIRFDSLTPETIDSAEALRKVLAETRRERMSVAIDELIIGITGISVPVLSSAGDAIASITASMPTVRYSEEAKGRIGIILQQHAALLEKNAAGSA